MTDKVAGYVRQLQALRLPHDTLAGGLELTRQVPGVLESLASPERCAAAARLFPESLRGFVLRLCEEGSGGELGDILAECLNREKRTARHIEACLTYVTAPSCEQLEGIHSFIAKRCGSDDIALSLERDESLVSGFRLQVENEVFDWSAEGRLKQLEDSINSAVKNKRGDMSIISLLKAGIAEFELQAKKQETGRVKAAGDGIAAVSGLEHAAYGEIILFDTGVKGMVQDIRRDEVGCILFGSDSDIEEGCRAVRTGRMAGVPVGEGFLGRVVDPLGAPIDGLGDIRADGYNWIEAEAPGIVDRQSVCQPMETGMLAIDSMFPIGRGQRELIIGDRQTGKTAMAVDTILNQKGKDVICVYVAVGQKASSVARVVETLRRYGALEYSIVVCATASDSAPLQYIAPYSGCAMAEYFMNSGRDVLIVYDDLSKHAVAYRALSLLLGRSPGREAYPGDVFYLHSRLLERAAKLSDARGGGSMTALPIIETQAGDVSAYIPTNVISITDGQIFLESDLFLAGQRPAVNVGLSVSRVGGAAQTKVIKKAAGSIRLELAQYREMEVFTQFSSDLDESTKEQLRFGEGLMQLLKQKQYSPMTLWQQVVTLVAAEERVMLRVPTERIKTFQEGMLKYFAEQYEDICSDIERGDGLSDELRGSITAAAREYLALFLTPAS